MTTNFTLRDFLVYFSSGAFLIIILDLIFFESILNITEDFFSKHTFIKEFAGLLIIFVIPLIYILGHILHGLGFLSLKIYIAFHSKLTKWNIRKYWFFEFIRKIVHFFMYKNKVVNSVLLENMTNQTWNSVEQFWESCAELQVKDNFGPANYWYTLNDLFKGLYTTTFLGTIICLFVDKWILCLIFLGLMFICHFRAIQFADCFVLTVKRLSK
ncbi:hypothetical protein [Marinifilum flexuosum]|uniref:Uncharacterized protein n=1 Tax=Marinifilum flexuosum TaxID=1117708 RepID=A0A419X9F6_9BACT|nr:hypothetical protein [Marinifilum flexuosum]RKE04403.1 hypothetical protein BXY64_1423 [Marinifilum flexuosum]